MTNFIHRHSLNIPSAYNSLYARPEYMLEIFSLIVIAIQRMTKLLARKVFAVS
jgi:hypothetical protein